MVVFENFYLGYDGASKKIINYHLVESFEVAKKAAKEYIKRFFPKEQYKVTKEENSDTIIYTLENKHNLENSRDIEYIAIYDEQPKSYDDFVKTFDRYQEAIDKRHKDVIGIDNFTVEFVNE